MGINVTHKGHMGNDLTVVNAARVSFGKESEWDYEESDAYSFKQHMKLKDKKLIQYLAKHKHISPFGHCFASFHIKAPIFVARQLVKHKFLRWNEISRRYVDTSPEFYEPDWRARAKDKKQGSGGSVEISLDSEMLFHATMRNALTTYDGLLEDGVCPEQARIVLPQSMMTEWYWSGSLDAWVDMCNLRCSSDTQAETREVANQISVKMWELFPESWEALRASK
jgi:thymidylate synthase (FAD)